MRTNAIPTLARASAAGVLSAIALGALPLASRATPTRDFVGVSPAARGLAAAAVRTGGARRDLGRMPAGAPVRMGVQLRYRSEAELQSLVRMQGVKGSPYYHRYLSNAQWNAYFAPTPATLAATTRAFEKRGFRITRVSADRSWIDLSGSASAVETAFGTELHRAYEPHGRREAYVNVRPATLPAELRASVVGVAGLHSNDVASYPAGMAAVATGRVPAPPRARPVPRAATLVAAAAAASPKPVTTSTPAANPNPDPTEPVSPTTLRSTNTSGRLGAGAYGPASFAVAYDYPVQHGYGGTGRTVGNVISGDFFTTDAMLQVTNFGLSRPSGTITRIAVDTNFVAAGTSGSGDVGESTLDAAAIIGLAPNINYDEYLINTLSDVSIEDGYDRVVSDNLVDAANSSFGGCEDDDPNFEYTTNYIALQGAAKGITFMASSGDTGGNSCGGVANGAPGTLLGVSIPSSDYYFTGVGGTDLAANPDTGARVTEIGWSTGGGGVSVYEAIPDFQASYPGTVATGRNVPDVALDAALETGYSYFQNGKSTLNGGTSLSSPLMTAMVGEIDQVQGSRNGWIVPRLYQVVGKLGYGFEFFDETTGDNQRYRAAAGYDNVTGLGSPFGWELAGTL